MLQHGQVTCAPDVALSVKYCNFKRRCWEKSSDDWRPLPGLKSVLKSAQTRRHARTWRSKNTLLSKLAILTRCTTNNIISRCLKQQTYIVVSVDKIILEFMTIIPYINRWLDLKIFLVQNAKKTKCAFHHLPSNYQRHRPVSNLHILLQNIVNKTLYFSINKI